ncbi:BOLA class I histocompatibility antigen, alpha chain BL3-6-like isoform X2 [Hoplias malabaricus]|uniref:BOLA class I histocompatibility antigen, alpha chain BL3-6-like isoform X2 n=1 Tax=Hoplias malabaricus TaxID=27720 RepID=UPI003461D7CE
MESVPPWILLLFRYLPVLGEPPINITVSVGSTAVLPCDWSHVSSTLSSSVSPQVEWRISSGVVFERLPQKLFQGEGYEGRVDVPEDQLLKGNCSLVLNNVRPEDEGEYECNLLLQSKRVFLQRVKLSVVVNTDRSHSARRGSSDEHSLFYLFTVQSDLSVNNTYQFSVETLLDDTQIDSYSSRDGIRTPKQSWVKKIEESEWRTGTEKLKNDGYLLHEFLVTQMKFSGHDPSERHVLQWRLGCEGETLPDGSVSPLNCINDLHYDGEDLISYNWVWGNWTVSASQSSDLEKRWNNENRYLHSAVNQKCEDCVKWLRIYLPYVPTVTKPTVPDVYVFVKKSQTESSRLTLTCLATGFYPKDLKMRLRRFTTSLPDHLLTSSGVRPNGDGTYQLRKSVDVQEEDTAGYDCYVEHSSLHEPIIKPWDGTYIGSSGVNGWIIGGGVLVVVVSIVIRIIVCKIFKGRKSKSLPQSPPAGGEKIPLRFVENSDTFLQIPDSLMKLNGKKECVPDSASDSGRGNTGSNKSSSSSVGDRPDETTVMMMKDEQQTDSE